MEYLYQRDDLYVVLTRFNVNMDNGATTKVLEEINPAIDEGYLSRRFELFERYTVPSMKAQRAQNFIWLVLFHADTPVRFRQKIDALQQEYPALHPLFIPHTGNYIAAANQYLLSFGAKRYITARIDNDDAFHCDFMQTVQSIVTKNARQEYLILFSLGLQYHEAKQFATRYHFTRNHFSVFVTPNHGDGTLKNILDYNHMMVADFFEIEQIENESPLWLELVHESNVSNRMHVERKNIVSDGAMLASFGCALPLAEDAVRTATVYAVLKTPINALRLLKMYGLKGCLAKAFEKIKRS